MTNLLNVVDVIGEILDNNSVSAFMGAVAAFLLVQLTDRRRLTRDHRSIKRLVRANHRQARDKLEAVERNIEALTEHNKVTASTFMRFATDEIKALEMRALDRLSAKEKLATDALCYQFSAIDDLLEEATSTAVKLKSLIRNGGSTEARNRLGIKLVTDFQDAVVNLRNVGQIAEWYIDGDFSKILEAKFSREDLEQ